MLLHYFELHDALEFPVSPETLKSLLEESKTQKFNLTWSSERKFKIISYVSIVVEDADRSDIDIFGELKPLPNGRTKMILYTGLRPELYLFSGLSGLLLFIFFAIGVPIAFWIKFLILLLPLWFWGLYKIQELILLGKFRVYLYRIREDLRERSLDLKLMDLEKLAKEETVKETEHSEAC